MNKFIKEEEKYRGKRFSVVEKTYANTEDHEYIRDVVVTNDAVVILALDEEDNVLFVRQLREVIGKETLELPAGIIEDGENIEDSAYRELEEETGYRAEKMEYLGYFYSSCGFCIEKVYLYLATNLKKGNPKIDEFEVIDEVIKIPLKECYSMLEKNELIYASQNIALALYYFQKRPKI